MPVTPTVLNVKAETDTRLRNLQITGTLEVDGTLTSTGAITATGGVLNPQQVIAGDGAITIRNGSVILTKSSAAAITLAAPTAAQAGTVISVLSTTAQAHVITSVINAASTTATFGGAVADRVSFVAYNLRWWVIDALNITLG